jgi:hypothetical protein
MVKDCDHGNFESPQNKSQGHPLEIKKNMWGPRLSSVNENMFY